MTATVDAAGRAFPGSGTLGRREDARLLAGRGSFVADHPRIGMVEVAFVRSPLAHARVLSVDTSDARAMEGVVAVVTAADLDDVAALPDLHQRARPVGQFPLARDRVRYVGAPVVAVVARDRYLAEDAAEAVVVEYDELPVLGSIDAALAPDAPILHDGWPDNRVVTVEPVNPELDEVFARSRVISGEYRMHRHTAMPMETRGVLAEVDGTRLRVRTSTQVPHVERTVLARTLGLAEDRIQVIAGDVGGGFGGKLHVYPEDVVVAWLALWLRRPVRWIEDRREHLVASSHAREQRHNLEAAVDADGRILAVRASIVCDVGSGEILPPGISPSFVSAASVTGPYRIPVASAAITCVVTNKTPSGAYRGFGTPEMVFALERLIERVARETGQDSVALRRGLMIRPEDLPYETPGGRRIDSGSHLEAFERAVRWGRETLQRHRVAGLDSVGVGYASYLEGVAPNYFVTSGLWAQHETCTLRVEPDGRVVVASGLGPMGQGTETMLATLTAELLGVRIDDVCVRLGDTDLTPYGLGSFGSRSTVVAAGAIARAAERLGDRIRRVAAHRLETTPDDLVIEQSRVHVRGSAHPSLTLADVATSAYFRTFELPPDTEPGLEASASFLPSGVDHRPDSRGKMNICLTYANSTHAAVVHVDRETGVVRVLDYLAVHDAGPLINPTIVDGQIHGGIAQGIGGALLEELVYGPDGQPLVTSFMDYLVPTAAELPHLTIDHLETPSTVTPLGLKGAGEAGATGCAAAIANAVCDALADLDVDVIRTPLSPPAVRRLILEATEHSEPGRS